MDMLLHKVQYCSCWTLARTQPAPKRDVSGWQASSSIDGTAIQHSTAQQNHECTVLWYVPYEQAVLLYIDSINQNILDPMPERGIK